ncbi:MAG: carbamoyl-phosphate synthase large subunit [Spirochaetales bacterium]|nr:carbamoyl-phosphate synthase large subunit [Spirochaetales bacterium]
MPARKDLKKILIIGSGPIVIGQACEFDYSGTQAVLALKEEGYRVVLVNPNPATVMTTPGLADTIYPDPLDPGYVEEIIRKERPDAFLPTMGGQTGLNLSIDLHTSGVLDRYGVEVIGSSIDAIRKAEDRGLFKELVTTLGLESPRSRVIHSLKEALGALPEIGIPFIVRPSFTLGGKGGSIVRRKEDIEPIIERALLESPTQEALIEESLLGWKEFELEVMRDRKDNAVIVCSIENIDPMGVHTGDSITIAPIQTLSDVEYQAMRTAAIQILRGVGIDCGGSNVQFAFNPETGRMIVIEMNPRVSRSSALASKATGFPIARCSARLAVGYTLDEIVNEITGKTASCFEPALDYCAIKVPRFEIEKFPESYRELGTQMKSVGESLAMGRTFLEALNKAIRAAEFGFEGLEEISADPDELERMVSTLHPRKIFAAYTILKESGEKIIPELARKTGYDPFFLYEMLQQAQLEQKIAKEGFTSENLRKAKSSGLSDKRLSRVWGESSEGIFNRRKAEEIHRTYHFVDTCAGEFEAATPYFYSSHGEIDEGTPLQDPIVILGSGPNRIGQGLEFDTCCTLASFAFRGLGRKTILINSNPETVSTDYNVSDRLYLEPLTLEDVREVLHKEGARQIIVQLGGQTPLNMAEALEGEGYEIVGTAVSSINATEDRGLFTQLISRLGLRQPKNTMAASSEDIWNAVKNIGYPVLLRPSYVLGGRSMFIAYSDEELNEFLRRNPRMTGERPILVDQFLEDAFEYDVDALSDGENVYIGGIMEHIEAAGIHSGDSACVFPAYKSEPEILEEMIEATVQIARSIQVRGFLNIQFAAKNGLLYILEVNPRASRTVPFISKASGVNLVESVVKIWSGIDLKKQGLVGRNGIGVGTCISGWAVKEAMFSFDRLTDVDPILGPEMKSTGEVIGLGQTFGEAFAKAELAAGTILPTKGRIFVSVHQDDRKAILPIVQDLEALGFQVSATRGTADFLFENGIFPEVILKIHEGHPNIIDHMRTGRIQLLINTPLGKYSQREDGYMRIEAVKRKIPYTTTTSAAWAAVEGIRYLLQGKKIPIPLTSTFVSG